MTNYLANIQWVSYDNGGRKSLPEIGATYYPHIILDKDISRTSWSIAFTVVPCDCDRKCTISFRMLVDNDGTRQFAAGMCSGDLFGLYEGKRLVAQGTIIELAK